MYTESDVADDYIETEILPGLEKCRRRPEWHLSAPQRTYAVSDAGDDAANDFSELDYFSDFGFEEGPLMLPAMERSAVRMVGW